MNKRITLELLRNIAKVECRIASQLFYENSTEENDIASLEAYNKLELAETKLSLNLNKY